jgi:hypothetical protein
MSFACKKLCGHKLHRPHFSCLFCRIRRFRYRKMDKNKYHYNRYLGVVTSERMQTYVMFIDPDRRLARVKAAILKRLLTICEFLAN